MIQPRMQEVRNLKKNSKSLFILCFLFLILFKAFGLNVPSLKGRVNDLAGIIFADEEKKIEEFLFEVEKRSDLQIAVLTIPSLEGENLEDYSMRVAEAWQLGSKENDSGVLLLVAAHDRKMRIEVGYGLESTLTDADAGRIIRNIIGPEFRNGNYGSGILQGVKTIAGYVLQDETLMKHNSTDENTSLPGTLAFALLVLIFASPIVLVCLIIKLRFRGPYTSYFSGSNRNYTSGSGRGYSLGSNRSYSSGSGYAGRGGSFGGGGASGGW